MRVLLNVSIPMCVLELVVSSDHSLKCYSIQIDFMCPKSIVV